jgi:hypothetical protein
MAILVGLVTREAAADEVPSAMHFAATIYATNAAVALRADPACSGSRCAERYYSLVPVVGGLAQLSHAGFAFHEEHHGNLCVSLTFATVGAQVLGIAAQLAGIDLSFKLPATSGRLELSVVPYQDPRPAAGLGLAWIH